MHLPGKQPFAWKKHCKEKSIVFCKQGKINPPLQKTIQRIQKRKGSITSEKISKKKIPF